MLAFSHMDRKKGLLSEAGFSKFLVCSFGADLGFFKTAFLQIPIL